MGHFAFWLTQQWVTCQGWHPQAVSASGAPPASSQLAAVLAATRWCLQPLFRLRDSVLGHGTRKVARQWVTGKVSLPGASSSIVSAQYHPQRRAGGKGTRRKPSPPLACLGPGCPRQTGQGPGYCSSVQFTNVASPSRPTEWDVTAGPIHTVSGMLSTVTVARWVRTGAVRRHVAAHPVPRRSSRSHTGEPLVHEVRPAVCDAEPVTGRSCMTTPLLKVPSTDTSAESADSKSRSMMPAFGPRISIGHGIEAHGGGEVARYLMIHVAEAVAGAPDVVAARRDGERTVLRFGRSVARAAEVAGAPGRDLAR